ncbi:TetR/AcrR family transcriptional regulator [Streptomyces carpaticus]|uniref:DNA-binding transcriptional regulator, AcrR family n=2 Tax=Streptomyces TaxID=1883 RepID=A0A1I6VRA6_9ACTN|nr:MULTISPECIES: TetR/AcrR family transcriptional regulator [Streptomyces]UWM52231.1 TetR/AcrR family transcriptional regulator [Streptomyces carpaticus]SFT16238.1 DNA-binding transcriptional regulator, AcrR family [Streptomyces harbinensis]
MADQPTDAALRRTSRTKITPEREAELYEAVLELLRERGYDALTMDAVAARTRSSKATLYRQWGSKGQLVIAALRHGKPFDIDDIDTGTLAGDLREMARRTGRAACEDTELLQGITVAARQDEDLRLAMRELLIRPEGAVLDRALRRGVERGEVHPDNPALGYVIPALLGALIARPLIEDDYADGPYLEHFLDSVVLPALLGRPAPAHD